MLEVENEFIALSKSVLWGQLLSKIKEIDPENHKKMFNPKDNVQKN